MTNEEVRRWFEGQCSPAEQNKMEEWFIANSQSPELDDTLRQLLSGCSYSDRRKARKAFRTVCTKLDIPHRHFSHETFVFSRFWQTVAAVAIGFVIAMYVFSPFSHDNVEPDWVEIYASDGESQIVMLPDSSTMRLSPSSVLIYDKSTFMARREVFLNGGAYADIAKSVDATTFTVRCNLASVIVRGTKFDINSYAEDREMEVILYEGGVEVTSDFGGRQDTMLLHPGNIVKIDKLTGDCNLLDIRGLEEPGRNDFYFLDKHFCDIVHELERRFNKNIVIRNQELASRKFYAVFANGEDLNQILEGLNYAGRMRITQYDDHTIEIK